MFPEGPCALPVALTSSGRTGINGPIVREPEPTQDFSRFPLASLQRFAAQMADVIDGAVPGDEVELCRLLERQARAEIERRAR